MSRGAPNPRPIPRPRRKLFDPPPPPAPPPTRIQCSCGWSSSDGTREHRCSDKWVGWVIVGAVPFLMLLAVLIKVFGAFE